MMNKQKRVTSYFQRSVLPKRDAGLEGVHGALNSTVEEESPIIIENQNVNEESPINLRVDNSSSDSLERDPGLRQPIWTYPVNRRDEIRRDYWSAGPYQVVLPKFPKSGPPGDLRPFQSSWYYEFSWLEYSEAQDAAYCLPCYLFTEKPNAQFGRDTFANEGFQNWKKIEEIRARFDDKVLELLKLSSSLDPRDGRRSQRLKVYSDNHQSVNFLQLRDRLKDEVQRFSLSTIEPGMAPRRRNNDNAVPRTYTFWDSRHDEPFLRCLLELTEKGQIEDGTCKNGVFKEIERMMEKLVPGCGLKAKGAVKTRVKKLKH
ncbi:unnamed protein product [Linum tenue]|uniref:TTF-type domain-containing protein n=1 Tax=Linum tenue TaxID=586396 RepID=A0AAV0IW82_9ROSI|nr:unnamed protein product [Linum tenue]